jgi:hypothetical protein
MNYKIPEEGRNLIIQVDARLDILEVKGASVKNLFEARGMLMDLFQMLEEIKEEENKGEEKED